MAGRFKSYFLRGLAVLLPTVLTIWIFVGAFGVVHDNISVHIKNGLERLITLAGGSETELDRLWVDVALTVAGFLIALVAVCILGAILASVVGRTLWRVIEKFIMNTPLLRRVYPYIKQVTDFVLTQEEQKRMFKRVVAVEYPRKGVWSLGFVTGSGLETVMDNVKKEFLTVLIPTSPTPFTGFVIIVPQKHAIELNMKVEEALRFIVSGGVVTPPSPQAAALITQADLEDREQK
ncbi:MAG: DUF502 domain-containing protein [Planctomycetota bacterium]